MSYSSVAPDGVRNLETGTTTIALKGKDFVILGADRRATMGSLKASGEAIKVFELSKHIGLTIAGSVGDAQKIVRIMRMQLRLHRLDVRDMSVKAAGTLLSNILHASKFYPYYNQFILGGVDEDGTEGYIFDLDPIGGLMDHSKFTSTGSGSPYAYGVLEDQYRDTLTLDEGLSVAKRALLSAMARDVNSGDGVTLVTITADQGFRLLSQEELEAVA